MQPGDRSRIFRSLGLGLGSLLLLSGAVFASGSGNRANDRLPAAPSSREASESAESSQSPGIDALQGGEVQDPSESPAASAENAPGDEQDSSGPGGDDDHSGPGGGEDDSGRGDLSGPGQGGDDD